MPVKHLTAVLMLVSLSFPSDSRQSALSVSPQDDLYTQQRQRMVEWQIADRGVTDREVLRAMRAVPRHLFVPGAAADQAYDDRPLPIGYGQTISQPYIVAFMTEILKLEKHQKVLEIGTGSGYQAAVLAEIVDTVFTIEIVEPLARSAAELLRRLHYSNVTVRHGDGYNGWPEHAPFDGIIVTAAAEEIPQPLIDQLAEGGRMIIPAGEQWGAQDLLLVEKKEGTIRTTSVLPVRFVPLVRDK